MTPVGIPDAAAELSRSDVYHALGDIFGDRLHADVFQAGRREEIHFPTQEELEIIDQFQKAKAKWSAQFCEKVYIAGSRRLFPGI